MLKDKSVMVAAAQYPVEPLGSWGRYEQKIRRWVEEAAARGARVLLLPEYATMELASLLPEAAWADPNAQLEGIQQYLPDYVDLFRTLARAHAVYILAGTFPVRRPDGTFHNRAYFFAPDGTSDHQEKLTMTRFEDEAWMIDAGHEIKVFATSFGRLGINICYDSEFPLFARKQVEAGAGLILVPSCTGTAAGYHRVRIGCQARAVENQCFVVQSPTVGDAAWSAAMGTTVGAAGVYGPADADFDDDGVLAMGRMNEPGWVYAEIHPAEVEAVRQDGEVFNHRDWEQQHAFDDTRVAVAVL